MEKETLQLIDVIGIEVEVTSPVTFTMKEESIFNFRFVDISNPQNLRSLL